MSETETPIDIRDYIDAVLRRWYLFAILVPLCGLVGLFIAYVLPPVYEAEARVLIENQAIDPNLVGSTVATPAAQRLQLIQGRLRSRKNLLQLVDQLSLFEDEPDMSPTEKVRVLREGVEIDPIGGNRGREDISGFRVSFRASDPRMAAAVVNELVALAVEENVTIRQATTENTKGFFESEADELARELLNLEDEMSAFQRENADSLPNAMEQNRSELSHIESSMFEREREILALEEQRRTLRRTLDEGVDIETVLDQLTDEQRELRALERELVLKRAVFADTHPQVKSLVARIGALEAAIGPEDRRRAENLVADRRGELNREISLVDNRIALLKKQQSDALDRKGYLAEAINRGPNVAAEMNAMQRRYRGLERRYEEASRNLAAAETGVTLEVNQQAERFEVIEQAEVPDAPIAPNRKIVAAGGVAGGFAAAFSLIVLAELMNQSVRTVSDLERALNMRPVVTIPYIETESEVRRRVWRTRVITLFFLVVVPGTLYAVDQFVMPLQLIAETVLERTGAMDFIDNVKDRLAG
ncbi:MAG: GumC family protein [Paracoccaceae bacterium]